MPLVLITGGAGQLGLELSRASRPAGWELAAPRRHKLDLADAASIADAITSIKPALIINAAAYTAVDKAESEPEAAFALNRDAPAALARAASSLGVPFVHVSTDYVFSGDGARPYREDNPKAPLGVYGRSKSEGEDLVLAACPDAAIIRTSWVFSAHRSNFVKTMLGLGQTRAEVGVVADQFGRPTAAADLAGACIAIGEKLLAHERNAAGVFHFANKGEASWAEFAEAIFAGAEKRGRAPVRVNRIGVADYPTPARRPVNSRLDTSKIEALGIAPRPWRIALDECLDELLG